MQTQKRLIALILFALSSLAYGKDLSQPLSDYQASYELRWHGLSVGKSTHTLRRLDQDHYVVESHSLPNIALLPFEDYERSKFLIKNNRVQPLIYDFKTRDKRKKMAGTLSFDWKNHRVEKKIEGGNTPTIFPIPDEAQDKITQIIQLRLQLLAGKRDLKFTVVEPKGIKTYDYHIVGKEKLQTPIGTFNTLILEHTSKRKGRVTRLWLAEELNFTMVKLVQMQKGKITAEATIEKLQG